MYESQRETLYAQQFNMEQTRFTVESIQDTVQTVQALKAASGQMKATMKASKELNLNFIDGLQVRANAMLCVYVCVSGWWW
jgi:Snf7